MQFYSMATIMMAMAIGLTLATGAHPGFTEKTFTLSNGSIGTAYLRSDFVHTTATQRQSVGVHAHSKKPPPPSMTAVDKRWSADFHPGEWEMYCEKVSMDDKTDRDSATADDCQELWAVFNETPGYWSIRDWNNGGFEMLAWYETCIVALSRTDDDYKNGAWIGNGDAVDWLGWPMALYKKAFEDGVERVGAMGTHMCPDSETDAEGGTHARIIWWITPKIQ